MNENHQRHLLATFRHVENLLAQAERALEQAASDRLFPEYTWDAPVEKQQRIRAGIRNVRAIMQRALADLHLTPPAPTCGALWAARGHVAFAIVALAELEPKRMAGYGPLTTADTRLLHGITEALREALDQVQKQIEQP